jgi:hypothetical protein
VTSDFEEAARCVGEGKPVVLVGENAEMLGQLLRGAPDEASRERLLAVLVGDPSDAGVVAAAAEMAAELWPWAGKTRPGTEGGATPKREGQAAATETGQAAAPERG